MTAPPGTAENEHQEGEINTFEFLACLSSAPRLLHLLMGLFASSFCSSSWVTVVRLGSQPQYLNLALFKLDPSVQVAFTDPCI